MSVPFSNTNLRIPRGFGNLLEGLSREVLRDRPEDIPSFAAQYFSELLKAREESGIDPADWGARVEDRFYNNYAFKETTTHANFTSPKANTSSKSGDTKMFENNNAQQLNQPNVDNPSQNELDKKLDEESGEAEHAPEISHVETVEVDVCAEDPGDVPEQVSENTDDQTINDVDICRSELDPTPLHSIGGLANVDVCAEEINPPLSHSDLTEDSRDMDGPESQDLQNSQFQESSMDRSDQADEISEIEDTNDPESYGHIEASQQGVSENTDDILGDMGTDVNTDKSTERGNGFDKTETVTITTEAEKEEHTEDELLNSENMEVHHDHIGTIDIQDEPETPEMKDTYVDYSDESKSEVIDVLDEVVGRQYEAEHNTSNIIDALDEEELLESQAHAPEPDSVTEGTEDVTGNEILNTDVMDTSEKDPISETVNEASDIDSDAEEMDQDDVGIEEEDPFKSMKCDDILMSDEQDILSTEYLTNDSEVMEEVSASGTEIQAEVIADEHGVEAQEQNEQTEGIQIEADLTENQKDKNAEEIIEPEIKKNSECSEEKDVSNQPQEEEDIMDIPLDDPEANKAAAKIQAGFRGHMTRKKMKPGENPGEEVSSSGEALNGSEGDEGGTDAPETDATSGPEQ